MLTLIPTGKPTSGAHCFIFNSVSVRNLQKIAKGQEFCFVWFMFTVHILEV